MKTQINSVNYLFILLIALMVCSCNECNQKPQQDGNNGSVTAKSSSCTLSEETQIEFNREITTPKVQNIPCPTGKTEAELITELENKATAICNKGKCDGEKTCSPANLKPKVSVSTKEDEKTCTVTEKGTATFNCQCK